MDLIFLLLGGACLGIMASFNGQLSKYFGLFEVSLLVHLIGAVLLTGYIALHERKRIRLTGVPNYVYLVGFMGVGLVASSSFCTVQLGATAAMSLSVVGQMAMSAVVDHYGLFGAEKIPFNPRKLPSYGITLAGILLIINK